MVDFNHHHVSRDPRDEPQAAHESLLQQLQRQARATISAWGCRHVDPDDLASEAYIRLLKHGPVEGAWPPPSSYCLTVIRNALRDQLKWESRRPALQESAILTSDGPGYFETFVPDKTSNAAVIAIDWEEEIGAFLQGYDLRNRLVFGGCVLEQTLNEISSSACCSITSVFRLRKKLRNAFAAWLHERGILAFDSQSKPSVVPALTLADSSPFRSRRACTYHDCTLSYSEG